MQNDDLLESSLHSQFQDEKINRLIIECTDIEILRNVAIELLKLHKQKRAIAQLLTKIAPEADLHAASRKYLINNENINN